MTSRFGPSATKANVGLAATRPALAPSPSGIRSTNGASAGGRTVRAFSPSPREHEADGDPGAGEQHRAGGEQRAARSRRRTRAGGSLTVSTDLPKGAACPPGRRPASARRDDGGRARRRRRDRRAGGAHRLARARGPLRRLLGQHPPQHVVERARQPRARVGRRRRRLEAMRPQRRHLGVARERHAAGQRLEEHAAERVDVGAAVVGSAPSSSSGAT